jgi:hypothetical protein
MNAKEKAEELYLKYRNYTNDCSSVNKPHEPIKYIIELGMKDGRAKQCALIAVDEILKASPLNPNEVDWDDCGGTHQYWYEEQREQAEKYWQEVKQEIKKL